MNKWENFVGFFGLEGSIIHFLIQMNTSGVLRYRVWYILNVIFLFTRFHSTKVPILHLPTQRMSSSRIINKNLKPIGTPLLKKLRVKKK